MMRLDQVPRLLVRLGCFTLAVALMWPIPLRRDVSGIAVQASPFVTICTLLAGWTFKAGMILGLAIAAIAMLRKRWFCRYGCPTGLLLDGISNIGFRKSRWWARCPSIGRYILLLTAAGAVVGYPLFLWMDPLALFSSAFSIRTSMTVLSGVLSAAGLTVLLLVALTSGDLWCARICPMGAAQDLLAGAKSLFRNSKRNQRIQSGKGTIFNENAVSATRRSFLAIAAGVGLGLWSEKIVGVHSENAPLRPPGAVSENRFSGLCVRCGNCIRACPSGIVHPDSGRVGVAGLLAPIVRYETEYCLEDCNACTRVCPSGALQDLSLERKHRYVIGEALVDGSLCLLVRGMNDCDICVRSCPFNAVQIYWNEGLYVAYPMVDPQKCNGCGACEVYCPTENIKAIRVWKNKTA